MRIFLIAFLLVFSSSFSFSQKIVGDWKGNIDLNGTQLPILFHFNKTESGTITGTWDSPQQNAMDLPFSKIEVTDDSVHLDIKTIGGSYQGKFIGNDSISGMWHQGGGQIGLSFGRGTLQTENISGTNTQAMESQFAPNEKEIAIYSSLGTKIYGTLLSKNNLEKIAIIIAGSGPTDREGNNPLGVNANSYKMLAHELDAQNIASFRYDKSTIGKSVAKNIKEENLTIDLSIKDAEKIIDFLQDTLGFKNIYLIGHSEGSLIGMVLAQRKDIKGYISVAGTGRRIDTVVEEQTNTQGWPDSLKEKATSIFKELSEGKLVDDVPASLAALFRKSVQPYLISLLKYSPEQEIKKVKCPILILQGTCDIQVTEVDANNLHNANKKSKLEIIMGMSHTLKDAGENCVDQNKTYTDSSMAVDANLVKYISGFIQKN